MSKCCITFCKDEGTNEVEVVDQEMILCDKHNKLFDTLKDKIETKINSMTDEEKYARLAELEASKTIH